jgi:hypothetical protein
MKTKLHAEETDPRLHPDSTGWGLKRATITDPSRPRVLLIGDSILTGYHADVVTALEGRADVDVWINPYYQSEKYNELLGAALNTGPYDVVHFNIGLHGWPPGRIKEGTFEPLTKAFVEVIRKKLPNVAIIWASSTPIMLEGKPTRLDPTLNPIIIEHNRMATNVMTEMNVPMNDFYSLLVPDKLELARGDIAHWTPPAYRILAEATTASIVKALEDKPSLRP